MRSDYSDSEDLRNIALLACIAGGLRDGVTGDDPAGVVDSDAAATVWLLAQAGVTLDEARAYLCGERSVS